MHRSGYCGFGQIQMRCVLLAALLVQPVAASAGHAGLIEIQAPGYRVITDQGEAAARYYLQQVERFRQALEISLGRSMAPSTIEARLFVLSSAEFKAYFGPAPGFGGLFVPHAFANYLVVDGGDRNPAPLQTVFHEYTHYYLSTQFPDVHSPVWFHEGLAEVMETAKLTRRWASFMLPGEHIARLRERSWTPLEQVLELDADALHFGVVNMPPGFYAQSWALVHYAINGEPQIWKQLHAYLRETGAGVPVQVALKTNLGMGAEELNATLQAYVNRPFLPELRVRLPPRAPPRINAVREVGAEEGAVLLAEASLQLAFQRKDGAGAWRALPLLERITPQSDLYPRALVLRALMAAAAGDDAQADMWIESAAAAVDAADAGTFRILGTILLHRVLWRGMSSSSATRDIDELADARAYYESALAVWPDDLEAIWGFGMVSAWADIAVERAVDLLQAGLKREPRSEFLALALGYAMRRIGQTEQAREYWQQAERLARVSSLRRAARRCLQDLEGGKESAEGRVD